MKNVRYMPSLCTENQKFRTKMLWLAKKTFNALLFEKKLVNCGRFMDA